MGKEYLRDITVIGLVPSLGPVILFDDMEDLFKWSESDGVGDFVFEKDSAVAFNGSASLHMITRTAGAAPADVVTAWRRFYQRPGKRYRVELLWNLAANARCNLVTFKVSIMDGSAEHRAAVFYDSQNLKWLYMDSGSVPRDVVDGAQNLCEGAWHRLMFEIDEVKGEYLRMVSDGLEIDLGGTAYYNPSNGAVIKGSVLFSIKSQSTAPPEINIDDVLIMEV